MHPKYIIAGDPKTGKGFLRMGMVINHKDLIVGYEKVWGGGWWARNDEMKIPCTAAPAISGQRISST